MKPLFKRLLFLAAATLLVFLLIEGAGSCLLFVKEVVGASGQSRRYYAAAEDRRHTGHDPELGWVGLPNRDIPDLYGAGNGVRTERHGFRNDRDVEVAVGDGLRRAICSGDSFTFGQGVANNETWCQLLGEFDPRLETVNMGQRGYGVDQAYLWYRRDGEPLDHDLHLMAFISGDFGRMQRAAHHGYAKPVLTLQDGELVVGNTPVPQLRRWRTWMSRFGRAAANLRSVKLAATLLGRSGADALLGDDKATQQVAAKLFTELQRVNTTKGSRLVLVWLPTESEIEQESRRWRQWLIETSAAEGWIFFDLSDDIRRVEPGEAKRFFIQENDTAVLDAAGHYTEAGNTWVAEMLHRRLTEAPWWNAPADDAVTP